MNTETDRHLKEMRDELAAVRRALDRLEERLGDLEEGLRSESMRPGLREAGVTSRREPREDLDAEASPSHLERNDVRESSRPPGPAAVPNVGDRVGAEPDLAEFSLGMADEAPALAPAMPVPETPSHREPISESAASASFDQDDLLRDLFAGMSPPPTAPPVPPAPSESFDLSSVRDAAPRSIASDDELEAGFKAIHAPAEKERLPVDGDRSPSREQGEGIAPDARIRTSVPERARIDFSTDELEELLGPDRR